MAPSTSNAVIPLAANSPTAFNTATNRISAPGVFNYDNGGNLTAFNGNTLSYNAENQLKSVQGLGISETILYDAAGQRVLKSLSSGATAYVFDAFGNLAAEYANGTTWSRDYIRWGGGQLIATENAAGTLCTTCYFSYDHLGSVRMVTDATATVKARHDYLPYGEEIAAGVGGRSGLFGVTTDTNVKFTGQLRDLESGQDYFNARYFAGVLGRFHSPDPGSVGASLLSSQSWNGYTYALNDPCDNVDPAGLAPTPCTLNIRINTGSRKLTNGQWSQLKGEIDRILGQYPAGNDGSPYSGQPTGITVNLNGPADFTATLDWATQVKSGDYGRNSAKEAFVPIQNSASVYMTNLKTMTDTARTIVHEYLHWAYNTSDYSGSNLEQNIFASSPSVWLGAANTDNAILNTGQIYWLKKFQCPPAKNGGNAAGYQPPGPFDGSGSWKVVWSDVDSEGSVIRPTWWVWENGIGNIRPPSSQ